MKVIVTGATGFIGRHVTTALISRGHSITAVARNADRVSALGWPRIVNFVPCDVHQKGLDVRALFGPADAVIHLAWPGLPNYKALYHFDQTLFADYLFLRSLVVAGYPHLLVTGSCLEYGIQNGCLHEAMDTRPVIPYGVAKDALRRFLEMLRNEHTFTFQWARLFYMFGSGQNPGSLLAQLDRALEQGDEEFLMSGGEQLRDYMPVEKVASDLVDLLEHPECNGVVNVCSGKPVSVRRMVEEFVAAKRKTIRLNIGHYPYPDYEPMAFWGARLKLQSIDRNDSGR